MSNPKGNQNLVKKDENGATEVVAAKSTVAMPSGFGEPTITRPEYLFTAPRGGTIVARIALPTGGVVLDTAVWKGKDGKIGIRLPQYVACKSDDALIALDAALRDRLAIWAKTAPPMPTQTRGANAASGTAAGIDGL